MARAAEFVREYSAALKDDLTSISKVVIDTLTTLAAENKEEAGGVAAAVLAHATNVGGAGAGRIVSLVYSAAPCSGSNASGVLEIAVFPGAQAPRPVPRGQHREEREGTLCVALSGWTSNGEFVLYARGWYSSMPAPNFLFAPFVSSFAFRNGSDPGVSDSWLCVLVGFPQSVANSHARRQALALEALHDLEGGVP